MGLPPPRAEALFGSALKLVRDAGTLHARARSTAGLAVFGALTGISALAALFLGILLAG